MLVKNVEMRGTEGTYAKGTSPTAATPDGSANTLAPAIPFIKLNAEMSILLLGESTSLLSVICILPFADRDPWAPPASTRVNGESDPLSPVLNDCDGTVLGS